MRQVHPGRSADIPEMAGVHGAGNGLHTGRMAEDPRDGYGRLRHTVFFTQFSQDAVELRKIRMVDKAAFEHAELQRGPGLDRDIVQAAVIQDSIIPVNGTVGRQVVEIQSPVDQLGLIQGELELVEYQGLPDILLQEFQLLLLYHHYLHLQALNQ